MNIMTNKEFIFNYLKSYEKGRQEVVNEYLHPKHIWYAPGGKESFNRKERLNDEAFFFSAFSNIKVTVEDQIAEDDKVASRVTMHCRHSGKYQGIPATNRRITISYLDFVVIKDGRIYQEWAEFNMPSILEQLQ